MNKEKIFPKRLAYFGLVCLLLILALSLFSISKTTKLLEIFRSNHVPALQMSCAATRLMGETNSLLMSPAASQQQISLRLDVLKDSIKEILNFTADNLDAQKAFLVTESYRSFSQPSFNTLDSVDKSRVLDGLKSDLQNLIESSLLHKNNLIENNALIGNISIFVIFFGVVFLFILMYLVYRKYQTNLRNIDELTRNLEKERLGAMNSSKLASLGEMAAGLAHEINNPLAVIIGRTEMLISQISDGTATDVEINKTITKISDMSLRISKIISSMRKIAKSSSNNDLEEIGLLVTLEDVLNLSQEKIKLNSIVLDYSKVSLELMALGSFTHLSQVIINLINNSVDELLKIPATDRNIEISTEEDSEFVYIVISDSGMGIPVNIRSKLFEPFFTTKEVGKGTGLGLSISKTLMNQMNGDLFLKEKSARTTFVIKLQKIKK